MSGSRVPTARSRPRGPPIVAGTRSFSRRPHAPRWSASVPTSTTTRSTLCWSTTVQAPTRTGPSSPPSAMKACSALPSRGAVRPGSPRAWAEPKSPAGAEPSLARVASTAVDASELIPGFEPETDLERRVSAAPELLEGLALGPPRAGHPEGAVATHVAHLLEALEHSGETGERRELLRFMALVHDAFKYQVRERLPRVGENHH